MDYFKIEKNCSKKTLNQLYKSLSRLKVLDGYKVVDNLDEVRNINEILVYWINVKKGTTNELMVYEHTQKMIDRISSNEFCHYQYTIDDLFNNNNNAYTDKNITIKDVF